MVHMCSIWFPGLQTFGRFSGGAPSYHVAGTIGVMTWAHGKVVANILNTALILCDFYLRSPAVPCGHKTFAV